MKHAIATIGLLTLAACGGSNSYGYGGEVGSSLDDGGFGNPTMHNTLVMTGQRPFAIDLSNRFATEVPSTVNFTFNSPILDASARHVLREQAKFIRQFPEVRFRVYGHTDLVGSDSYNRNLGLRRAQAVVSYLSTLGISRSRLEAVVSFGETQPLVVSQGQERRNRRTVTEVSGFVESHPTVLQGKYAAIVYREYIESATEASTTTAADPSAGQ